ncbi:MAG: hypothetical protein RIS36_2233 [Pseudomonadota bacterium]
MAETKLGPKYYASPEAAKADQLPLGETGALKRALAERRLQIGPHALDHVLEAPTARQQDQRQEQQLYASTWGCAAGFVAALIKVTNAERDDSRRKALEAIQAEMFELLAKEKKRDALRNSPFFKQLVAILGHDTAESITQKLEAAGSSSASGLQANQAALAQASKDIAALLDKNPAILGLRVGGQTLAGVIESEIKGAIGRIPQPSTTLSLVKPEESLATRAHELIKGLERGDERLSRLQSLRDELGPQQFTAMVDAYDAKYGIPLVAHVAALSSSNPSLQTEILRKTSTLLTPEQQGRVIEYGRAEYAQTMALLDKQREAAKDNLKDVTNEIRATERTLAASIGNPELANLPEGEVRGKILEDLAKRFPELSGKSWKETYIRLKDVVGQSDPKALGDALRFITGGKEVHDLEALRDYIARATLQMQKLAVLDQQVDAFTNILSTNETSDEAKLRKHYTTVYGEKATTHDAAYGALKSVADSFIDNLHRKIADTALGTEERAALIRERDALEFSCVKKLASDALHGRETPDPDAAISVLKNFAVAYADTPARRGESYRSVCEKLVASIESAKTLREEWQEIDVAQFANVDLKKPKGREVISCIDGRPTKMDDMRLAPRVAGLDTKRSSSGDTREQLHRFIASGTTAANSGKPVSRATQLEILQAQRQAALSTDFFAQILEGSGAYSPAQAPLAQVESSGATSKGTASLERIEGATSTLDEVRAQLQKELLSLEGGPRNEFLSRETQHSLRVGLSQGTCDKLQALNGADAVAKVVRELDPVRDLTVDREVLDAVRNAVPADTEIGKACAAISRGSSHVESEYEAIKSRLNAVEALRFDLLIARETDAVAQKRPSVVGSLVADVLQLDPNDLYTASHEAREHARLSRVERLLGALTDEEHQAFLRFFEATTQRSLGQGLIATLPGDGARSELLLRLAGSRCATSRDLQRFYSEPVPSDRSARVAALARALSSDAQRPAVKADEVRQTAHTYGYHYANLREAARVAMGQGDVGLVSEIAEKMRSIEARMSGTITKTVAQLDASYVARSGLRDQLQALQEEVFQEEATRNVPGRPNLNALAKETAELLRASVPKTDAAFNRIRQANLSEEESLYLRALYGRESKQPSPELDRRSLTGILQRDLEPLTRPTPEERERLALLTKGGEQSLRESDKRTLAIAEREQNEKRQLDALSNLRATGQYERAKEQISSMKLTPAAREYHNAVVAGDTKKADAADLSLRAKNGDVKPLEVASFLKDKSPSDLERIAKDHPTLAKDIAAANPFFTEQLVAQLMSKAAEERQRALEQLMLKSLTSPNDFAAWLDMQGSRDGKRQMLRNLEALIEKQPNAPKFVEGAESKIVQYVRAQRTDFREIDAHLIGNIISSRLGEAQSLTPSAVNDLLKLREEAVRRMSTLDAFEQPRRTVYNAAQENLSEKRRYLAEAQADQDRRWVSAGKYDNVIALSKARIAEQDALVRPMTAGIRDIETSRELVRYAFALMAKDAIARADRGLRPELTDNVTTLLMQRDQAIRYKVTDQKRDAEWIAAVKSTSEAIQSFDKWSTIGLGTAKVLTTMAAGIVFSPAAGLIVATAWNAGDKVYRGVVGKESVKSLAKSLAFELAIDTAFAALSALKTTTVTLAGGSAVKGTAAEGLKVTKRVWEFRPWQSILKPHSIKELSKSGGNLIHSSMVVGVTKEQAKETFGKHVVVQKMAEKYFQKLADMIPDELMRSPWAQVHIGRTFRVPTLSLPPSSPTQPTPSVDTKRHAEAGARGKLAEQNLHGSLPDKRPKNDVDKVPGIKQVAREAPAVVPAPQTVTSVPEVTFKSYPALLREIEAKLQASSDADVQQAINNLKEAMSRLSLSISECEQRLRDLQEALNKWTPYPELAGALDKLLSGSNPFLAFLDAPSTRFPVVPPPPAPPPPPQAPPPPPKDPENRPGSGGMGMPGPALMKDQTPRGHRAGDSEVVLLIPPRGNTQSLGVNALSDDLMLAERTISGARHVFMRDAEVQLVKNPQTTGQGQQNSTYEPVSSNSLTRARKVSPESGDRKEEGGEHEIHVALKEREPRGAIQGERRDEAPRMIEKDGSQPEVARKQERPKVEGGREETVEATLAQQAARSAIPTLKSARTEGSEQAPESKASFEARKGDRDTAKAGSEGVRWSQPEKRSIHEASVESSTPNPLTANSVSTSPVSSERGSVSPVTESGHPTSGAKQHVSPVHDDVLEEMDASGTTASPSKRARNLRKGDDARMRQLLLQQLMDQHTTKARREKILKALIALGISEVEYRKLLVKLGEMDTARIAEQAAARTKVAEPMTLTVDAPAMKEAESATPSPVTNPIVQSKAPTTRAALYKRLKEESATVRT